MLKFGDPFRHNEKEFVFLASSGEIIYAALILNSEDTEDLNRFYKNKNRATGGKINTPLYCFTILKTEEFRDRAASFAKTDHGTSELNIRPLDVQLCNEDLKNIKREIENGPLPSELKDLIRGIDLP